ncbi:MAG: hypothetical protein AAFR65_06180 [Pseudomonadota bacterium]
MVFGCGDGRGGEALVFAFDGDGGLADPHFIDEELKTVFSEGGFFVCREPRSERLGEAGDRAIGDLRDALLLIAF